MTFAIEPRPAPGGHFGVRRGGAGRAGAPLDLGPAQLLDGTGGRPGDQ
ncbi:hypothetical protein [Actinomadura rubrisoli]|nr:hypothetical protein [Actinomadura rubrisoli]